LGQPGDSFELLDKRGEHFHAADYAREFGPFLWTYVVGFGAFVETLLLVEPGIQSLRAARDFVKAFRVPAAALVPEGWKTRFPDGDWATCNATQIGRACEAQPVRFDKACQAVKTLELAFARASSPILHGIDIYRFIQLRPAIFVLRDLDDKGRALLRRNNLTPEEQTLFDGLVQRLCPADGRDEELNRREKAKAFLFQAADGYAMTWVNAKAIKKYLREGGVSLVRIEILTDRTDKGRMTGKKNCNTSESFFVALDEERLRLLNEARVSNTG
jgi:hypothetical protein